MSESDRTSDKSRIVYSKHTDEKHTFVYKKLVVPMTKRSIYWKCYGFPANENGEILTRVKIVCLLCKHVIAYNGNTSNLRMHLQNKHPRELNELEASSPPKKPRVDAKDKRAQKRSLKNTTVSNMYTTEADGSVQVDSHMQIVSDTNAIIEDFNAPAESFRVIIKDENIEQGEENVAFLMSDDQSFTTQPVDRNKISDAIAEMAILDLHLPDVVHSVGFQRLVATLRSPCEIPSKSNLVDDIIPKLYDNYKDLVRDSLLNFTGDMAISIEEWQSANSEMYVTFSAYYLQHGQEDHLQTKVLSTLQCSPLFNTEQWGSMFDSLMRDWGVKTGSIKAVIMATDHLPLVSALEFRNLTLIPCLIYTLQTICTKGCFALGQVSNILVRIRALLALIYKNSNAQAALHIQENLLQLEDGSLTSDYPKAWISTYVMLEQLAARRSVMANIIDNLEPTAYEREVVTLSDDDWAIVEEIVTVLEPFKVTTMTLAEEKAPLISLLKPLLWQLISVHLKVRDTDSTFAQELKTTLCTMLKQRYSEENVDLVLKMATTLDPRFKQLPYSVDEAKAMLNGPIKEAFIQLIEDRGLTSGDLNTSDNTANDKRKARLSGMKILLGDFCATTTGPSVQERAELEITQYQAEPTANLDHCPLTWWQKAVSKFANLARLASSYNCIPATATPPVRIPVEAQIKFEMKRAKLSAEIVDKLLFLNSNYEF